MKRHPYILATVIATLLALVVWLCVPKDYTAVTKLSDEYKETELAIGFSSAKAYLKNAMGGANSGINDMERVDIMKPHIVKIDRELISDIDHIPEKQGNVKSLVGNFHSKNILVVAEGIERKEEFDFLKALGVDLFQGFYLARPE